ncbi:MAG TPA: hypothetical protein PK690_11235, partial [Emcibacteraceae bacterium]|nr:hypothetical protein [Emcibacteraceae bacterium]
VVSGGNEPITPIMLGSETNYPGIEHPGGDGGFTNWPGIEHPVDNGGVTNWPGIEHPPIATTMALGEEGDIGVEPPSPTLAIGEYGEPPIATTMALGEEGDIGVEPPSPTLAIGEYGEPPIATTMALGEEGDIEVEPPAPTNAVGEYGEPPVDVTTMAGGEEGDLEVTPVDNDDWCGTGPTDDPVVRDVPFVCGTGPIIGDKTYDEFASYLTNQVNNLLPELYAKIKNALYEEFGREMYDGYEERFTDYTLQNYEHVYAEIKEDFYHVDQPYPVCDMPGPYEFVDIPQPVCDMPGPYEFVDIPQPVCDMPGPYEFADLELVTTVCPPEPNHYGLLIENILDIGQVDQGLDTLIAAVNEGVDTVNQIAAQVDQVGGVLLDDVSDLLNVTQTLPQDLA